MTIKVSDVSGGPYAYEIDAIRDERYRARVMNIEPDFDNVFKDVELSPGAYAVIGDLNKPIELPVGEFVENVVFHEEEEAPEDRPEETPEEALAAGTPAIASEETGTEQGNGETGLESTPVVVQELAAAIAPVADATPIFSAVEGSNVPAV